MYKITLSIIFLLVTSISTEALYGSTADWNLYKEGSLTDITDFTPRPHGYLVKLCISNNQISEDIKEQCLILEEESFVNINEDAQYKIKDLISDRPKFNDYLLSIGSSFSDLDSYIVKTGSTYKIFRAKKP